jgi:hypothetical protein
MCIHVFSHRTIVGVIVVTEYLLFFKMMQFVLFCLSLYVYVFSFPSFLVLIL